MLAGVIIAQPDDNGPGDVNVRFTTVTYNSMTVAIDKVTTSDGTAHCSGPLTWVTNDLTNTYAYLATIGEGEGAGGRLWGYEVNPATGLTTHAYDTTVEFAICPDSICSSRLIRSLNAVELPFRCSRSSSAISHG